MNFSLSAAPEMEPVTLKSLIAKGKTHGYITFGELSDHLPLEVLDQTSLDTVVEMLGDMGIGVYDHAPDEDSLPLALTADDEDETDEAEALLRTAVEGEIARSADPLRAYMREMGAHALLTREGEIDLARRIETGLQEQAVALAGCPAASAELLSLADRVDAGELRWSDIMAGFREPTVGFGRPAPTAGVGTEHTGGSRRPDTAETCSRLQHLRSLHEELLRVVSRLGVNNAEAAALRARVADEFLSVRFAPEHLERIAAPVRRLSQAVRRHEREILSIYMKEMKLPRRASIELLNTTVCEPLSPDEPGPRAGHAERASNCEARLAKARDTLARIESEAALPLYEFKELHRRMSVAAAKARKAKNEMVEANLRLVIHIARKYLNRGLPLADLIQEGNMGLMKAVDRFDHRRGFKFSTYATWWIRQAVGRAIADKARSIRIPVHVSERLNKLNKAARAVRQKKGREALPRELADATGLPEEKVHEMLDVVRQPISTETPMGKDADGHLGELIEDHDVESPFEHTVKDRLDVGLRQMLATLSEREARILERRFGIGLPNAQTLAEVGEEFAVSRERIRQIENQALRKLRSSGYALELRGFLDT